ncbi:hypothetical protein Tco_1545997 [Tanacetum coccineum]
MDAKATVQHDYTIIESPRAVVFPVDHNDRKIMRFNEIYKFSDGTLTRILEALDYRVKEFKVKRLNSGMNTRFWTEKDVTSPSSSVSVKYSGPSLMVGDFNEGSSKDYMRQARVDVEHCGSLVGECSCHSIGDGFQHCVDFVGHLALLSFEIGFKLGQSGVLRCHEVDTYSF